MKDDTVKKGPMSRIDQRPRGRARRPAARMEDVAREAGVSLMTVSRALHQPDLVSKKAHARISDAMSTLGYVRDLTAQALASQSSRMIGVVVPTLLNPVFSEAVEGLSDGLESEGYQLLVASSGFSLRQEERAVETILGRRPDSVIVTGQLHSRHTRQRLLKSGVPIYEMGNVDADPLDTAVGASNSEAAHELALHLLRLGYRNIAYIGGHKEDNDRAISREKGFLDALAAHGLEMDPNKVVRCNPVLYGEGLDALEHLLTTFPEIDAVFCSVEVLAIGVLCLCQRRGIKVPDQLAIACFDSGELSSLMSPPLTRILLPRYELGRSIAEDFLNRRNMDSPSGPRVINLGYRLIEGGSA